MCAIIGFTSPRLKREQVLPYFEKTKSRGPDDTRMEPAGSGLLGFHRLAIMGLHPEGMQPFHLGRDMAVCNGELYGFRPVKAMLEAKAVISGIFAAGGDSKFGFICDGITMWCVTVPIGLIAAFVLKLPVLTVYILINIDEIIKLPAVLKNYRKHNWVKNLTRQEPAAEPEALTQAAA